MVSENTSKIMLIGPPITEKRLFKKLKILLFLLPFISKTKIVDIFNFPSLRCFGYCLSFEYLTFIVQLLLKLRTVELPISVHLIQLTTT